MPRPTVLFDIQPNNATSVKTPNRRVSLTRSAASATGPARMVQFKNSTAGPIQVKIISGKTHLAGGADRIDIPAGQTKDLAVVERTSGLSTGQRRITVETAPKPLTGGGNDADILIEC